VVAGEKEMVAQVFLKKAPRRWRTWCRENRIGVGGGKDTGDALRTLCPADLEKTGEKLDTFDFPGFKHVCGTALSPALQTK
jgi:hypothetical protein